MGQDLLSACWLPPELQDEIDRNPGCSTSFVKQYDRPGEPVAVSFQRLSAHGLEVAASFLRSRREEVLQRRPVREIARILDVAAERWLDSSYQPRRLAIEAISAITGFSPQMVAHSIDLEQISSRGPHLIQALVNEIGDPSYLDGFRQNQELGGYSMAVGPGLVGAIFSSNIPALPHLEVMRAFLVKAACLGRVSAGEPVFLSLYAQTLGEIDPELASCLAVTYWERNDHEAEMAFLEAIDYLVAYGGDRQVTRLLSAKPPSLEATWHGHRMGFTYVCSDALAGEAAREAADKVSYDFTIFDGHACLCPQVCFVERGGKVSPQAFAEMCASEMSHWAERLPPRKPDLSEASSKHRLREICLMKDAMHDGLQVVAAPGDFSFMVVVESVDKFEPSPGERFVRIVPVDGLADVESMIRPMRRYLQCAAVACGPGSNRFAELRDTLASWGVSRVVPPGLMGTPSMMWHHDGVSCLGKMITWCDHEMVAPEILLRSEPRDAVAGRPR